MEIKKSEFTISAPRVSMCPKDTKAEYAFIGRSNVGKSSLINMLCNHKGLAKTSATPGKTLLINHFIINNQWYLVDLPGYGFAKRSKTVQKQLEQMISSYILQRQQLANVFVLIDVRHVCRLVGRKRRSFLHRLYQGRQVGSGQGSHECGEMDACAGRPLGSTSTLFHYQ